MSYYSKRHYALVSPKADTSADVAARKRHIAALEQVTREREERYPDITPENAVEVIRWQEARIRQLVQGS